MSASLAAEARHAATGHPRRWVILGVLVVSLLLTVVDNTVLNVVSKTLADPRAGLGASQAELEWSINAYTVVFAALLFSFGVLGDRYGRRRILLIGLVLFGLASAASAYSHDPGQLIAARALMGLAAAAVLPATLSIISMVFDKRERSRAIAVWSGTVGAGVALGPIVSGLLLKHFWWGSVFLINVPVVLLGVAGVLLVVPESHDPAPGRLDIGGGLLSIAGLSALVFGIIDGGEHGFGRPQVWLACGAGLILLAAFVGWERRSSTPSLEVTLFRNPRFSAATLAVAIVFFSALGAFFFLPFYLQSVRGYSPLQAGVLVLPFAAAQLIFAPASAVAVRRFGAKAVCAAGLGLTGAALASVLGIAVQTPVWVLAIIFFVQGAGMALVSPPAMESVVSTLPRERAGVGSAVVNTVRQVSGALGIAILGAVVTAAYRRDLEPALGGLPPPLHRAANESIAGAHAVADALGSGRGPLIAAADRSFVTALHWSAAVSAALAVVGVAAVLRWLPGRR